MRHVLSAVVQNVPGVLAHISGMLASRGYNIDSLAVGATEDPNLSRMTFVVPGDEDRSLHRADASLRHYRTRPHRPHRHGPRRGEEPGERAKDADLKRL